MSTSTARSSYILATARVTNVQRVSPTFIRITFAGEALSEFGTPGDTFDTRIKLIFPTGPLPAIDPQSPDWYQEWLDLPEDERGSMRTYSVRFLRISGSSTRVVVDFVLHLSPGLTGPASRWAAQASEGDEILLVGPRRGRVDRGGIEYAPGTAESVILVGDETAAPAIARILEDAPASLTGTAFIEVPLAADQLPIAAPPGVDLHWHPRGAGPHGSQLIPAVLAHLGAPNLLTSISTPAPTEHVATAAPGTDSLASHGTNTTHEYPLVWETPTHSSTAGQYFWIAGESTVVTTLRRHLVKDLGIDRTQIAFMGYWRRGVAMRN